MWMGRYDIPIMHSFYALWENYLPLLSPVNIVASSHSAWYVIPSFIPLQCDLPYRQVDQMEIESLYKEYNFIGWTETSAKDGLMVNDSMK
jgi:hypothetical protein